MEGKIMKGKKLYKIIGKSWIVSGNGYSKDEKGNKFISSNTIIATEKGFNFSFLEDRTLKIIYQDIYSIVPEELIIKKRNCNLMLKLLHEMIRITDERLEVKK
jgi:hypothetical protein